MEEPTEPVVSQESIAKGRSRLGLGLAIAALAVVVVLLFSGNGDDATAADVPATPVPDHLAEPIPTVMTLATGADTAARTDLPTDADGAYPAENCVTAGFTVDPALPTSWWRCTGSR